MKEIVESYFQQRSLVNHQLASYNDCIPSTDGKVSRMEKIVRNIRIGTDEIIEDDDGGIIKGGKWSRASSNSIRVQASKTNIFFTSTFRFPDYS